MLVGSDKASTRDIPICDTINWRESTHFENLRFQAELFSMLKKLMLQITIVFQIVLDFAWPFYFTYLPRVLCNKWTSSKFALINYAVTFIKEMSLII